MTDSEAQHIAWSTGGAGIGFGNYSREDEYLHPAVTPSGDTVSETWLYMWYIPEESIYCLAYVWVHPNLGVVTSAITAFQGHKDHQLEAELSDWRHFASASCVADGGNGADVRLPNGLRIEIVDPLECIHLTYHDAERANLVDVTLTATSPPIMRENSRHFDQVLHAEGRMVLRGKEYAVNGNALRDRSWGELRPEHHYPTPPFQWLTGTFPNSKLSWHLCAYDDPAELPDWLGLMPAPEKIFREGWIYRDGEMLRLKRGTQITVRDPRTRRPLAVRVSLTDACDREYRIQGTVTASTHWSNWPNMQCHLGLARWEMAGELGWGDMQEFHTADYVRALVTARR